jgi:hypothetical protein
MFSGYWKCTRNTSLETWSYSYLFPFLKGMTKWTNVIGVIFLELIIIICLRYIMIKARLNKLLVSMKSLFSLLYFVTLVFLLELHFWIHYFHHWTISDFTQGGYRGFYSKNTIDLTPKVVNDIHKRGGTILGTSRGGHDTSKIVDSIQDRGINQVYCVKLYYTKVASLLYQCTLLNSSRLLAWDGFSLFGLWLQVYIIGGDGTQRGAAVIYEVWW